MVGGDKGEYEGNEWLAEMKVNMKVRNGGEYEGKEWLAEMKANMKVRNGRRR